MCTVLSFSKIHDIAFMSKSVQFITLDNVGFLTLPDPNYFDLLTSDHGWKTL